MPIGTLREKSLHAALKLWYAQPGDELECKRGGFVVDIVRGEQCIEIQTRNLSTMKKKLHSLLENYPVRVVHPIAKERIIVRIDKNGEITSRKSPKRGTIFDLFPELVSFPALIQHPTFSLEVVFIREEQIWRDDGLGSWRRKKWSIQDRRLLEVIGSTILNTTADFAALLPPDLPPPFEVKTLAKALRQRLPLAGKMAYCLREMGVIERVGKRGNAWLYALPNSQ